MRRDDSDFERFSRDLDAEWLRQRLQSTTVASRAAIAGEESLLRELEEADPLAPPARRTMMDAVRELLSLWPGRLVFAAGLSMMLALGFLLGRIPHDRPQTHLAAIPPRPISRSTV